MHTNINKREGVRLGSLFTHGSNVNSGLANISARDTRSAGSTFNMDTTRLVAAGEQPIWLSELGMYVASLVWVSKRASVIVATSHGAPERSTQYRSIPRDQISAARLLLSHFASIIVDFIVTGSL